MVTNLYSVVSKEGTVARRPGSGEWFTGNLHHSNCRYPKLYVALGKPQKRAWQLGTPPTQVAV